MRGGQDRSSLTKVESACDSSSWPSRRRSTGEAYFVVVLVTFVAGPNLARIVRSVGHGSQRHRLAL